MIVLPAPSTVLPGRTSRSGAAAVEFALLAPILVTVLLGMIELSRATLVKVMLSDAARKGCRTGIQRDKGNSDITADCTNIMQDNGFDTTKFNPANNLGAINITVTDPFGNPLTDSLDAPSGSIVSVQVSIPVSSTTFISPQFLGATWLESQTVVMMKQ